MTNSEVWVKAFFAALQGASAGVMPAEGAVSFANDCANLAVRLFEEKKL